MRRLRQKTGVITSKVIADYRRLAELKAMDLPDDDARVKAHGEIPTLTHRIGRHFGLKPWSDPDDFEAVADMLAKAAGLEPRPGRQMYEIA